MPSELEISISKQTPQVIPLTSRRPAQVVLLEMIGAVVWVGLCWALLRRIFAETATEPLIVHSAVAMFLGMVLADFVVDNETLALSGNTVSVDLSAERPPCV